MLASLRLLYPSARHFILCVVLHQPSKGGKNPQTCIICCYEHSEGLKGYRRVNLQHMVTVYTSLFVDNINSPVSIPLIPRTRIYSELMVLQLEQFGIIITFYRS